MPPPPPFEVLMPEIESRSRRHYSHCNPELREERVQESVCAAWALYDSAVRRKNFRFTPATLAWYANRATDERRKFGGGTIRTDALDGSHVGLDDLDCDGLRQVAEALIHETTPVLDQVRVLIDYPEFMTLLPERERDVVRKLAEGWRRGEIAGYWGVSPARITQLLHGVADAYVAYLGVPGFEYRARKQEKRKRGRKPKEPRAAA